MCATKTKSRHESDGIFFLRKLTLLTALANFTTSDNEDI